jgi:CBS domain-containing protein
MKVCETMTRQVVSVPPDASILQAGELMLQHHISGLPVVDPDGHVVGIVTERDFLRPAGNSCEREPPRWFELLTGQSKAPDLPERCRERKVAEVMTRDPATVAEDTPLEEVVRLLEARDIKRLPVVRDGRLVGVISRADMLRALVKSLRAGADLSKRDEAVRARLTELERQSWLHRTRLG